MASIFHKGDRVGIKHKRDGKWVYEYLGRGTAAEELAKIKKYDYNRAAEEQAPPGIKFGTVFERYLASRISMSDKNKNVLAYRFTSVVSPLLGGLDASLINHAVLHDYITTRKGQTRGAVNRKTGGVTTYGPPALVTIQNEINLIMTILNFAAYRCQPPILSENPARGFLKGKVDYAIIEPPTEAEIAAILKHASPHLYRAIIMDIMCGARPGQSELFQVQWTDVDLVNDKITIISAKKGGIPKRDIPLSQSFREHLLKWREEDLATGGKFIIHYRGKPVGSLQTSWEAAKRRAGINRRLRIYDFRHYFVTKMLEGGADLKSVSRLVGHVDETMVLRKYQHLTSALKRAAIDMIPSIPLGNTAGNTGNTEAKNKITNIKQKRSFAR